MSGFSAFPGLYYVFGICCIDFVSGSSPERGREDPADRAVTYRIAQRIRGRQAGNPGCAH